MARERGIRVCIGSDAHCPEHVAYGFDEAVVALRECGYTTAVRYAQRKPVEAPLPV
jgi:histidinol-phosphatase (PHP family)